MENVAIIILAAGASIRLGQPKQLVRFRGRSLLRHAAETALASACHSVVVVLGSRAAKLEPELTGLPVSIAKNPAWETGMGSSIAAGLKAAPQDRLQAVILMVCDQPMVSTALLNRLVDAHQSTGRGIVASEYAGTRGVPAFFSRSYFAELAALPGGHGAKGIIVKHAGDVAGVAFPEGGFDVDSPSDFSRIEAAKQTH